MFSTRSLFGTSSLSAGLGLLAVLCMPSHLMAQTGKSLTSFDNICLAEARRAEAKHGIPTGLMQSIARVESGRKMVTGEYMPWAWTLNDRGEGLFFDDRDSALAYLKDAVASPGHSVDVGCMQVNTKWHADGFPDVADMLDPVHNASYAAGFLLDLHAAHQSWDEAVKHYHSAEPRKNVGYHRRVLAELERFMADTVPEPLAPDDGVVETASNAPAATGDADDVLSADVLSVPEIGSTDLALVTRAPTPLPDMTPPQPDAAPARTERTASAAAPPVTVPHVAVSPAIVPPVAVPHVAVPHVAGPPSVVTPQADMPAPLGNDAPAMAEDPLLTKQPNLAPHRSRVEHFRRLLARQAG